MRTALPAVAHGMMRLMLAVALGLLSTLSARGQEPSATARVDTNSFLIGGQIGLTVAVDHDAASTLRDIGPADSLEGVEIVARAPSQRSESGGRVTERTLFTITSFDTGMFVIPPFAVYYTGSGDTTVRSVRTAPVPVFVHGVEVDTAGDIREIKPPLGLPLTFLEILPYILAVILAAGTIWIVSRFLKKRKSGERFMPGPPPRPPDEIALEALRSLGSERLWERGKIKEYHSALTDILRTYIEDRYLVPAMESTSDETLSFDPIRLLPGEESASLKEILYRSDLVKFAKFVPDPADHERSMEGALEFVERTRVKREEERSSTPASGSPGDRTGTDREVTGRQATAQGGGA